MNRNIYVVALFLFGCQPYLTYEELEEGAKTDPKIEERLYKFERDAALSDSFSEDVADCVADRQCVVQCVNAPAGRRYDIMRVEFKSIEDKVQWYRMLRFFCSQVRGRR